MAKGKKAYKRPKIKSSKLKTISFYSRRGSGLDPVNEVLLAYETSP